MQNLKLSARELKWQREHRDLVDLVGWNLGWELATFAGQVARAKRAGTDRELCNATINLRIILRNVRPLVREARNREYWPVLQAALASGCRVVTRRDKNWPHS